MTEIGAVCWRPYDDPLRVGSAGRLLEDWYDLRIADPERDEPVQTGQVGQILVRSKKPWTLMQGYMGMPEKTTEAWRNLWFQTGDAGYFDDEGYLYFVDRLGDRIRRRAESISSYDIEAAAMLHPAIADCAAVGVASEFESDDDVKLCVVLGPDRAFDPVDLLRHLSARLPHYMVPRYIDVLTSLPRTPTNKVMKKQLRTAGAKNAWDRKSAGVALRDVIAGNAEADRHNRLREGDGA
jgi:crotonobetaine/carnitine-CoA ligase